MHHNFFNLSQEKQSAFIKKAGEHFDVSDIVIEKDLWICWILEKLFALPVQMAFKGGTSLSKVFGLIQRFSEDCDITIDYRNFKPALDLETTSRTQLKKISEYLKEQLKTYIAEIVLPYLQEQVVKNFPQQEFEILLSEDGEQLRFYYPSMVNTVHHYLRDHVLIEFGVRNSTEPCEKYLIEPYLTDIVNQDIALPKSMIDTLSPIRTFWEKATLIHVECYRDRWIETPERLSRHWYDLYMLNNTWVGTQALANREILKSVIIHKKAFYNSSYANYANCLTGKFRLIPSPSYLKHLALDFKQMIEAGMFHHMPSAFDKIIESLEKLEVMINETSLSW